MLKKALSIFISVLMVISLLPVLAFADTYTNPTIYADNATSTAGNTVSIAVYVANNPGVWGMDVIVSYDRAIMTLSKVTNGEIFDSSELTPGNINSPNYILSYSSNGFDNNTKSGVLATITFSINESTAAGKYTVGISYTEGNIIDCESKDVAFDTVNGSVTVEAPKCDHALSLVAGAASTCTVQGTKAHYVCSKCNALFADAEGTIETTAEALQLPLDPDNHGDGLSSAGWTKKDGENHAQICKNCQKEITEAHKWNDGEVTTPATHTTKGVKTFKCTVCEATKTEDIPTLTEHSYGDWSKLDDEYHHRTCVCGDEQKEAHKWDDGKVTTPATHTTKGVKTFQCTVCEATKTEDIPTLTEHFYGDWSKLDDEYHHRTCVCGDEQKEAHKWDDGVVTTPATHTTKGVKTFKCTVCEATKTEDIPTLTKHSYGDWSKLDDEYHHRTCVCGNEQKEAHKWDDGEVTVEPTEDKDGTRTLTCTVCGAKKDVVEPYHVHDYDKDFDDVKWSANASYHWKKCACGEIAYKSAHVSSDWIVDGYPNPVSIGMMHKECVICGYTLAREILPATGGITRPAQTRQYTVTATAGDHGSISHAGKTVVKSGDNVTYVITPDEGYEIASVLVNGADIGAVREYTFWNVKSDCTISVSFREIPAAHYNPFVDVNPGDAYYDAVLYVYENGLFKGVSETEFAPDTTMTRAMFVTVLGRMAGVNPLLYQKSSFTDVEVGQWYSPYVEWAAQSGIVLGYGDGTFGLNDEITVEQAAVILARYAAFTGRSTYTLRTLSDFADSADVSDWAVYSMKWIVNTGIYTGENGMLSPKSLAKRSLVAAMLYNYAG